MLRPSPPRCEDCAQHVSGLFCGLTGAASRRLEREKVVHRFRRGQSLFYEGEPAQSMFVICAGRVKVFTTWVDGDEQVLRLLGPGDILGFRPLLAGEPYGAGAEAVEDSTVCIVPADTVRGLIREVPQLALDLLAKLATELRVSEGLMMDLLRRPVRQRVARLLVGFLGERGGGADPLSVTPGGLRRKDMARIVGTSPETFSRVLRSFAHRGVITLTRDHIRVRDARQLRRIAGEPPAARLDGGQDGD